MRGGHCLKVWTKKQQVVSLSSAESELYAAIKTASEGLGIQSVARDLGKSCRLNLHLDASAAMCLVHRRGLGKAKHVDMQNLWIQEAFKSGRFVTEKVGTSENPADLMTKPIPKARIEQLMSLLGFEFMSAGTSLLKGQQGIDVWREFSYYGNCESEWAGLEVATVRQSPKCCVWYPRAKRDGRVAQRVGRMALGRQQKAGGSTRSCAPKQDVKKWSTSVVTRCT